MEFYENFKLRVYELVIGSVYSYASDLVNFYLEAVHYHYWFASLFVILAAFFIVTPFSTICKNETSAFISLIRFLACLGSFSLFISVIFLVGSIGYCVQFESKNLQVLLRNAGYLTLDEAKFDAIIYASISVFLGGVSIFFMKRNIEPALSHLFMRATKKIGGDDAFSDIRNMYNKKVSKPFAPEKYFNKAANNRSLFFGLNEDRKPLFVARELFDETNVQICGGMGSGKGVQAQVLLSQLVKQGDTVITFDPKSDNFLPYVLKQACEHEDKPFVFINLRENISQISPFFGANADEVAELFIASFHLEDTGTDADVYKVGERKAAQKIARYLVDNELQLAQINQNIDSILSKDEIQFSRRLIDKIETLSGLVALQTNSGSNVLEVIKNGGCLYVIGDDIGVVKDAQKMLLVRVLQLIKNINPRDRRFVSIFADEVKALLCPLLVNQAGQLRVRRANIIFAHQSDADLSVLDPNLAQIFKDNAGLNWFYKQKNFDTAEEVAKLTGQIKSQTSRYSMERNEMLSETVSSEQRQLVESQSYFIDTNAIQTLPKRTAVLIGDGLAKIAFCSPIDVDNSKRLKVYQAPEMVEEIKCNHSYNKELSIDFMDVLDEK